MSRTTRSDRAFLVYAALPDRSIAKAHEAIRADPAAHGFSRPPSMRTLESWSSTDDWPRRAADLDREAARQEEQELIEQRKEHRERLRREGMLMQQKGLRWLTAKDADDVRASEAVRSISEGFKLEALGLGEPSERITLEERLANPLEEVSDDELERIIDRLRGDLAGGPRRTRETHPD